MMKKSRPADRPTSGNSSRGTDKHHHETNGSSGLSRKHSPTDKPVSSTKPLSKSLSKSHDNLASTLRKKAVQVSMATTSKEQFRTASPAPKFKTPKNPSTPIRKAQSIPMMDLSDEPMKRAQSVQNISQDVPVSQNSVRSGKVKRASSTQNVSNKNTSRHAKMPGQSSAMAYNAELLASFEKEKKTLERRISELIQVAEGRKTEIEKYKFQVKNLKQRIPSKDMHQQLGDLTGENQVLKDKLQELGVAVEGYTETDGGGVFEMGGAEGGYYGHMTGSVGDAADLAPTPDSDLRYSADEGDMFVVPEGPASVISMDCNWDKQSNKSSDALSEISVACLQDRISQMEETHYSTNEELQATLQELGDLQQAVNDLTYENERLADEKCVLLESLCAQTEKLENARMQVENLKIWLVSNSDNQDRSDNERQLVCLVKSTQEQKEELQLKQMELCNAYHSLETENRELQDVITALRDKTRILEMKNESLSADKRTMETQLTELREVAAKDQIELQRYRTALDNEKQKVCELEQERNATDKSDIEDLLACCRAEKERGEEKLTDLEEQLAVSQNENKRHREAIASLEEEVKVCKNNAKTKVSAMEYEVSRVEEARSDLQLEMNSLRDHIDQLQLDCDRYLDEKRAHDTTVMSLEHELSAAKQRCADYEVQYNEAKSVFDQKQEEWAQFQADLQTAVVIANEFKSEVQEDMQQVMLDKFNLKEENENLQMEIDRLKEEAGRLRGEASSEVSLMRRSDIRGRVMSTVDRGLSALRQGRKLSDPWGSSPSMSVKHLIHSIEEQVKSERCTPPRPNSPVLSDASGNSRRNSMDSPGIKVESPPIIRGDRRTTPVLRRSEGKENWPSSGYRHAISDIILDGASTSEDLMPSNRESGRQRDSDISPPKKPLTGILTNKSALKKHSKSEGEPTKEPIVPIEAEQKSDLGYSLGHGVKSDPLANLAKQMGGSKRNALLKWCQLKTQSYHAIDITNFSSSWNDGLAMCAILHSYLPDKIPYKELSDQDKMRNFTLAFKAAESVGITSILNVHDMVSMERPDWQAVMAYITSIYKHFEVDKVTS